MLYHTESKFWQRGDLSVYFLTTDYFGIEKNISRHLSELYDFFGGGVHRSF